MGCWKEESVGSVVMERAFKHWCQNVHYISEWIISEKEVVPVIKAALEAHHTPTNLHTIWCHFVNCMHTYPCPVRWNDDPSINIKSVGFNFSSVPYISWRYQLSKPSASFMASVAECKRYCLSWPRRKSPRFLCEAHHIVSSDRPSVHHPLHPVSRKPARVVCVAKMERVDRKFFISCKWFGATGKSCNFRLNSWRHFMQ